MAEKEYIERNDVCEKLNNIGGCGAEPDSFADGWDKAISETLKIIEDIPKIEIVRCKDCEFFDCTLNYCDHFDFDVPNDLFFCRDGVKNIFFDNEADISPAADVAPVRHGHWKKGKGNERPTENGFVHDDRYICDCCGWGCCCETKLDFSFCPKCGAKMDGGEGE